MKRLRIYELHFAYPQMGGHINIGIDGPWDARRILGTVAVNADGSAAFRVPANRPLAVQPLDSEGKALQVMRSWLSSSLECSPATQMNGMRWKIFQIMWEFFLCITSQLKILFYRWRSWAHGNKSSQQAVLLLIDDLETATNLDFDAKQNLRRLFLRGPARRVWPIITLNPSRMENIMPWLDAFRTKIFGPIQDTGHTRNLGADNANLSSLNCGMQFTLREGENWLKFWIPGTD